ncbi:MAG: hypothetical protein GY855_02855 [candidate division Zixibacteria bacterium]|nr:hypothetical protein [candidate division Zixibacteria bacterium]
MMIKSVKSLGITFILFIYSVIGIEVAFCDNSEIKNGVDNPPIKSVENGEIIKTGISNDKELTISLGYDGHRSLSPGIDIGFTSYDVQSTGRMNRQVDWRSTENIHYTWMKQMDYSGARGTAYQLWDATGDSLVWSAVDDGGGVDIHNVTERSGYTCIDVMSDGRALIGNHYDPDGLPPYEWLPVIWPDMNPNEGSLHAYRQAVPSNLLNWPSANDDFTYPQIEFQLWDGDTIIHIIAMESGIEECDEIRYFRRLGGAYPVGESVSWDSPPVIVDSVPVIGFCVTASRVSGKVALVWVGHWPAIPGDSESGNMESISTSVEKNANDIYYMLSDDGGVSWGNKVNITKIDSSKGGWVCNSDISALIDENDDLHVVYTARYTGETNATMSINDMPWPNFPYGSRLLHWSSAYPDTSNISIIKDGNWDWTPFADSMCFGSYGSFMSLEKPQISSCDGKFYTIFVQYNDPENGIWNDCHSRNWTENDHNGSANGELYLSISKNGGRNWDIAQNLTNSYTPHCDGDCDSDAWPSMSRFGMEVVDGNFSNMATVDPSGSYSGNYYLDVLYVNDKDPGVVVAGEGTWTTNPMKAFRIPCIDPVLRSSLIIESTPISFPAWGEPGVPVNYSVKMKNIGNDTLIVSSIYPIEIDNFDPSINGWLDVDIGEFSGTLPEINPENSFDITVTVNSGGIVNESLAPAVLTGLVVFESDSYYGPDTLEISFAVGGMGFDTLGTECIDIIYNNTGNLGNRGNNSIGGANMNFANDCDVTTEGEHNHAEVYLNDASPMVMRIIGDDTLINCSFKNTGWNSRFLPLEDPEAPLLMDQFILAKTGTFNTPDLAIGLRCDYFAPSDMVDCQFIIKKLTLINNQGSPVNNLIVGDFIDWNIPSDSSIRNGSGSDETNKLMYNYGFESNEYDPIINNDCISSDLRFGGVAYHSGMHYQDGFGTLIGNPQGAFDGRLADYFRGNSFEKEMLYSQVVTITGYESWEGNPNLGFDSTYQDIFTAFIFGQFDLGANDSLVFTTIIASEYDGGLAGLQQTIEDAKDLYFGGLCGDANNSGDLNILDQVLILNYLYNNGQAPAHLYSADVDNINGISNHDIQYLGDFKYKAGPDPYCPPFSDSILPIYDDTLEIRYTIVPPATGTWDVDFWLKSEDSICAFSFPFSYHCETSPLTIQSISFDGTIYGDPYTTIGNIDENQKKAIIGAIYLGTSGVENVPYPSAGLLATVTFNIDPSDEAQTILINTTTYDPSNIAIFSKWDNGLEAFLPTIVGVYECYDSDGDWYGDPGHPENICHDDNCPLVYNPDQLDIDDDGIGDACDNCPSISNTDQSDSDGDDVGKVCDNCPEVANAAQNNSDNDNIGDACDNCPNDDNKDQGNVDGDSYGDVCDECTDTDGDTFGNPGYPANTCATDNCPLHFNDDQIDTNGDDIGDACTFEEETSTGQDVETTLDNIELQFDDVTMGGMTEMTVTSTGPEASTFEIVPSNPPIYYNVTTDAIYDGSIEICITYDDFDMTTEEEESLTLQHNAGTEWANITTSLNTIDNIICGISYSLSPFVVAIPTFLCGDLNDDENIDILDIVYLINYKYKGGPPPDPLESADVNYDEEINILDIVYLINFKYKAGDDPDCP